jgi:DNA-binding transcriptional regulator YdaS (Cro superfamily)
MKIIEAITKAGGQSAFGRSIGVTQGAVHQWAAGHTSPSPCKTVKIEKIYGVLVETVRPDLDWIRFTTSSEAKKYGCKKGDIKGYFTLCCDPIKKCEVTKC